LPKFLTREVAKSVPFDNSGTGIAATDVQDALTEPWPGSATDGALVRWDGTSGYHTQSYTSNPPTASDDGRISVSQGLLTGSTGSVSQISIGVPSGWSSGGWYGIGIDTQLPPSVSVLGTGVYVNLKTDSSSTNRITNAAFYGFANNTSGTVTNSYGLLCASLASGTGTITNAHGVATGMSVTNSGTITNGRGVYVPDASHPFGGTITNLTGIQVDGQTGGSVTNYGLVLLGDGHGADVRFGSNRDASVYYDGTDLYFDAAEVGTGVSRFGTSLASDVSNVGAGTVIASGNYSIAFGYNGVASSGQTDIHATGNGSLAVGAGSSSIGSAQIKATNSGAWAGGYAVGSDSVALVQSSAVGSLAFGRVSSDSGDAGIETTGEGSLSLGYVETNWDGPAPPPVGADILSSGRGSLALGYVYNGSGGASAGLLKASGNGAVAMGYANEETLQATGVASFALGRGVQATANYSHAVGRGFTNSTTDTWACGFGQIDLLVGSGYTDVKGDLKINGTTSITSLGFFQPVSSVDGSAPSNSIYYSTTQSKLVYKDSGGNVNNLY